MVAVPIPQYRQLEAVLSFLSTALRADADLQAWLCRDPEDPDPYQIVRRTVEHNPFQVQIAKDGQAELVLVYATDLPLLAAWETSSEPVRIQGADGERVRLELLYLFQSHLGNAAVSPQAWAARISKTLWWRLHHLLRVHTFDGWGTTGDLLVDGAIHSIVPGRVRRLAGADLGYEGITAELTMEHVQAPYTEDAPGALYEVDLEVHMEATDGISAVDPDYNGPVVEGMYQIQDRPVEE